MPDILLVALGGGVGAVARYLITVWAVERIGPFFPYGTLIVNVAGCFLIGLFMALAADKVITNPQWRLLAVSGFLGGLTTFSSFGYETVKLANEGEPIFAFYNVLLNCLIGLAATWLGMGASRIF